MCGEEISEIRQDEVFGILVHKQQQVKRANRELFPVPKSGRSVSVAGFLYETEELPYLQHQQNLQREKILLIVFFCL